MTSLDVHVVVPGLERPHARGRAHALAIARDAGGRRSRAGRTGLNPRSRPRISKLAASRFTSHSHGPGSVSSKSLMSNISLPLGRAEHAEVRQVRVAAELDVDAGLRRRRQIGRHDQRGAAEEGERGHEHPPVANRNELRNPGLRPAPRAARSGRGRSAGGSPVPVTRSRRLGARGLPPRDPLLDAQVTVPPRACRRWRTAGFPAAATGRRRRRAPDVDAPHATAAVRRALRS